MILTIDLVRKEEQQQKQTINVKQETEAKVKVDNIETEIEVAVEVGIETTQEREAEVEATAEIEAAEIEDAKSNMTLKSASKADIEITVAVAVEVEVEVEVETEIMIAKANTDTTNLTNVPTEILISIVTAATLITIPAAVIRTPKMKEVIPVIAPRVYVITATEKSSWQAKKTCQIARKIQLPLTITPPLHRVLATEFPAKYLVKPT